MIQRLSVPVSVQLIYDYKTGKAYPRDVLWKEKHYRITKIGLHHTFYGGRVLYHVFSVSTQSMFLRLVLDSATLHWKLEEISDGLPD